MAYNRAIRTHAGREVIAAGPRPGRHVPLTTPTGAARAGGKHPHHARAAVTVEVTAHSVKRSRPTGPGLARGPRPRCGPTRRVAGPETSLHCSPARGPTGVVRAGSAPDCRRRRLTHRRHAAGRYRRSPSGRGRTGRAPDRWRRRCTVRRHAAGR